MPIITLTTYIQAPIDRCFNLSRSIDLHTQSMTKTGEKAIAGKTKGLIGLGETVTWRAKHFGIWQTLTSKIVGLDYPTYFCDEMQRGAFKRMRHVHYFRWENDQTTMIDLFEFESPLGILGRLANRLVLTKYMRNLLKDRNETVKQYAETEKWKEVLE